MANYNYKNYERNINNNKNNNEEHVRTSSLLLSQSFQFECWALIVAESRAWE